MPSNPLRTIGVESSKQGLKESNLIDVHINGCCDDQYEHDRDAPNHMAATIPAGANFA